MKFALVFVGVCTLACFSCANSRGNTCQADRDCSNGSRCIATVQNPALRYCMKGCGTTSIDQRLCDNGAVCLSRVTLQGDQVRVCSIGGTIGIFNECSTSEECEPGTVCVPSTLLSSVSSDATSDAGAGADEIRFCAQACESSAPRTDDSGVVAVFSVSNRPCLGGAVCAQNPDESSPFGVCTLPAR